MNVGAWIIVITLSIIFYVVGKKLYRLCRFSQRLNKIPGPKSVILFYGMPWEMTQLPKEEKIQSKNLSDPDRLDWYVKLALQYQNGIFRLWVGTEGIVAIQKPEHIGVILRNKVEIQRTQFHTYLRPWLGRALLTASGAQWVDSRKRITPAFQFGVLENFADVIIEKANIFRKCINNEIKIYGDEPFEIFELAVRCTLDIICETAMGVDIHAQDQVDNDFNTSVKTLGNDLDVQRKVHEELDEVLDDSDDKTTLKRLPSLKYLERVIKEALRLYPTTPEISRELIDDLKIGDYIIPGGTTLSIGIYKMHRDASVRPDPLRFDPDRLLPENSKIRHPYAYIPFSAGPRSCIRQKFAMLEAKIMLAQVLRNFTIKSVKNHSTIKKYTEIVLRLSAA